MRPGALTVTTMRCLVTGRVQGVFFRASALEQAGRLGVSAHARNLDDGSVEVTASGDAVALEDLKAWLWQGPSMARVDNVKCALIEP